MKTTASWGILAGSTLFLTTAIALTGCGRRSPSPDEGLAAAGSSSGQRALTARPNALGSGAADADTVRPTRGMMGSGMGGGMMRRMMGSQPADTTAAPTASAEKASAPGCPDITPALVEAGRKVFSGPGNCFACHSANAEGSSLAPNLTDSTWLDVDGSYAAIVALVRSGVPQPKRYPAPMPPMGGAQLNEQQVCAVAAYVHGLSGPGR